jgi:hypothetical protein
MNYFFSRNIANLLTWSINKLNIISSTSSGLLLLIILCWILRICWPPFLLQHLWFYNQNYFRLQRIACWMTVGLRNVIYNSSNKLLDLPTPKISSLPYSFFLPIMATILLSQYLDLQFSLFHYLFISANYLFCKI